MISFAIFAFYKADVVHLLSAHCEVGLASRSTVKHSLKTTASRRDSFSVLVRAFTLEAGNGFLKKEETQAEKLNIFFFFFDGFA